MVKINLLHDNQGLQFGTSGVRGLVVDMEHNICKAYVLAFLQHLDLSPGHFVAVGMDLRPSSPVIALACMEAILEKGYQIDFCGILPTPALAFYAQNHGMPAIMVTGSHIPFDRNGIKFYRADGEITKQDEAVISASTVIFSAEKQLATLPSINSVALRSYLSRYADLFDAKSLLGWRIGVYQHSSVARDCLVDILQMMGATVIPIERTDHFVPIDTEAVTQADEQKARDWVAQFELDALVTTDGDADRPLIADETGQWLRGDIVGLLTAQLLNAKVVVAPVSCNTALEASGFFENVLRTKIGSPYVIAGMQTLNPASQSIAGFEANGGFIAGENLTINGHSLVPLLTRDAMLPIVVLLGAAAQRGIALSALMANLPARYTVSDRLQNIPPVVSAMWLANWLDSPEALCSIDSDLGDVSQLDTTDGLRVIFQNGEVIHLRASGNAPELRCYVESAELKRAKQLLQQTFIWINQIGDIK